LPKSQQAISSLEFNNEPIVNEDKSNIAEPSEVDENPPSQYVSKRRGHKAKEADSLMM
jgi:hypothetical protein